MPSCQSEKLCDVTQTSEQPEGLEKDVRRQAYLVTYSRADTEEFNRRGFVDAVVNAFKSVTKSSIVVAVKKGIKVVAHISIWHYF